MPTRGFSSRAAVRIAVSTSDGTGRAPSAFGPAEKAASACTLLRFSITMATRLRGTIGSARKMFSSAAIASSWMSSCGSLRIARKRQRRFRKRRGLQELHRLQARPRVRAREIGRRLLEGHLRGEGGCGGSGPGRAGRERRKRERDRSEHESVPVLPSAPSCPTCPYLPAA